MLLSSSTCAMMLNAAAMILNAARARRANSGVGLLYVGVIG